MNPAQLLLPTLLSTPLVAWSSPDVISAPDDRSPSRMQVLGIAELAGIALRHLISLPAASTRDSAIRPE